MSDDWARESGAKGLPRGAAAPPACPTEAPSLTRSAHTHCGASPAVVYSPPSLTRPPSANGLDKQKALQSRKCTREYTSGRSPPRPAPPRPTLRCKLEGAKHRS